MYGVVCGVHQSEEGGSQRRLGGTRSAVFLQAFTVFAGEAGGCSQLLKKKKPNNNRLQMNETVCQVQSG